ncbi:asparagine synthase (glutamine-hydrolyzing) [Paludibacterium sp. B53371]|uniref:asparagine synthase (glutamine-hydrolyzing) n=1 Tax=Paludibacterium sp. B53371 TaxID=2806263 RepID=UPI001C04B9AE|nr:asparagine synthase (glutamine-hydrolyzing) [Paludibacterium sp. B53371]
MCGFTGFATPRSWGALDAAKILQMMASALSHRGPDDEDIWLDRQANVALAHRRLAIVDLSTAGHQPMHSASDRFVIVYNGEVYNYQELRLELEKIASWQWRGHSDTEVLLAGFETWGIIGTLQRSVGMFSFALWDKAEHTLTLARDRFGEKPLYYGWNDGMLLFGSELKALKQHPSFDREIDHYALTLMLRYGYVPTPHSIYKKTKKLSPGHYITIPLNQGVALAQAATSSPYWSLENVIEQAAHSPFSGTEGEAIEQLDSLLRQTIRQQQVADVPLGAFLSGGVDSSTIVALMQAESSQPVKTFSIGFNESGYNEAGYAKAVAQHLKTDHTELYVTPQEVIDLVPKLAQIWDEPFADSSQMPTYLVAELAKRQVTVALSGDAGDEVFAGYNRYLLAQAVWRRISPLPQTVRRAMSSGLTAVAPEQWDKLYKNTSQILPKKYQLAQFGDKLHKFSALLAATSDKALYQSLITYWGNPASILLNAANAAQVHQAFDPNNQMNLDFTSWMMAQDTKSYLTDDILVKVDRAAMANSLETRVPLLDHRIVEFAWSLPGDMKIRNQQGKWLLRQVLYKYVPASLIERPKQGFAIPIGTWLRGPLKAWAERLLDRPRLQQEGIFNTEMVHRYWQEHLSGKRNWQHQIWAVLMFQNWLEHNN